MTLTPKQKDRQTSSKKMLNFSPNPVKAIAQFSSRTSIRNKIAWGYAVAIGIGILGTLSGLAIGDRYYEIARNQMAIADEEGNILSGLKGIMLQVISHQQELILRLNKWQDFQQESAEMLSKATVMEAQFLELKSFEEKNYLDRLSPLIKYDGTLESYSQELKQLVKQLEPLVLKPDRIGKGEEALRQFLKSQATIKFHQLSHELINITETVKERQIKADLAQTQAGIVGKQIIFGSMLVSALLAILLALYTSRAIALPIQDVTKIAEKVTQDANFDLQVPVVSQDEIGVLATSMNQLIQQVKYLLKEQQATAETQLIQSEKMSSLGQMVAGIAHELNNPLNFITGNLTYASSYMNNILELLDTYQTAIPDPPPAVLDKNQEIELDFLREDFPRILQSMKLGAERATAIVLSLKDFARLDEAKPHFVDLHACLDSTLLILNNRIKKGIQVICNYGEIPVVEGYTSLLYQVFMNLLSNAIDALEEKSRAVKDGEQKSGIKKIEITTECLDLEFVRVQITDNGCGISPENMDKIFEIFFTTKPRGVGTGLGLAISHQIVTNKHRGTLSCHSELGKGTEFAIALPIKIPS